MGIISLDPHHHHGKRLNGILLSPFHREGNRGSENGNTLPKSGQQSSDRIPSIFSALLWAPSEQAGFKIKGLR